MKFEVINEKENPLLKRKEILVRVDYEGGSTASKAELQKSLSEHFKADIASVEISKILSEVGLPRGKAWVKVWEEKKVPIYSEIKKEAEKPVEAPKEEAKPEEKKEEPKEEKPQEQKPKTEEKEEAPQEQPKQEESEPEE